MRWSQLRSRALLRPGGRLDIDVGQIRGAGLRVLERGQFRARGHLSVPGPAPGIHSLCTYVVDLDRGLAVLSTVTAMDPETTDDQPLLSAPVTQWSIQDGLLVPLPSAEATGTLWACVPGEPLIQGPLAMLLWLAGALTAEATPSGAAWSTVVDVDRAVEHVASQHRSALQRSFAESGLEGGSQLELEVRLNAGAVQTLDAELPAVQGVRPRALLHLAIDAGQPPAVPEPPVAGEVADPDEIARAWAIDWPDDLPVRQPWHRT